MPATLTPSRAPAAAARPARRAPAPARAAAAEGGATDSLRIKLKCFRSGPIVEAADTIKAVAEATGATVSGPVPLPTRRRIFTLLRSPHVNKDSREQFETRTHSRLLDLKGVTADTVSRLLEIDVPAGVDVEIKV